MGFLKKIEFALSPPFVLTFVFSFFMTCTVMSMYQTVSAGLEYDKKQKECAANQSMVVYKDHVFWVEKPSACNIFGSVEEVETSTSNKCLPFLKEDILFPSEKFEEDVNYSSPFEE